MSRAALSPMTPSNCVPTVAAGRFGSYIHAAYFENYMTSVDNIQHTDGLDAPELAPYRTLRRPMDHIREGIFIAEGEKVVRRLLESKLQTISLLMTPEWYDRLFNREHIPLAGTTKIFLGNKDLVEKIVGYNLHQGIMAVARMPQAHSLHRLMADRPEPVLVVALDGLVNAENVGLVVRNCAAFGVNVVIVGETSCSPYLRRAVRNSMGTIFCLPVVHTDNLAQSLHDMRTKHQMLIIGAHPGERTTIQEVNLEKDVCLVFGNEGQGISAKVLEQCVVRAAIPMMNGTDSLNVASASAVFLYEARRQRGKG